jgi:ABC-2 type transport system permease protein
MPLDLIPEPYRSFFLALPFSAGVYTPVGYFTGRLEIHSIWQSFLSISIGIVLINLLGALMWKKGVKTYAGTGA